MSDSTTPELFGLRVISGTPTERGEVLQTFEIPVLKERCQGLRWIVLHDEELTIPRSAMGDATSVFAEYVMPREIAEMTGITHEVIRNVGVISLYGITNFGMTLNQGQLIYRIVGTEECEACPLT